MRVTARNSTIIFPPLYVAQSVFNLDGHPDLKALTATIIYKCAVTYDKLTVSLGYC